MLLFGARLRTVDFQNFFRWKQLPAENSTDKNSEKTDLNGKTAGWKTKKIELNLAKNLCRAEWFSVGSSLYEQHLFTYKPCHPLLI